jgi:hypothetical protein
MLPLACTPLLSVSYSFSFLTLLLLRTGSPFGSREGEGLQLRVEGALFAYFNMSTPSKNLINADYTIGIPATYRYGDNSLRFFIYHQSSHLGDELLMCANPPNRVNLSFESIELIYSREWREWRMYGAVNT